MSVKRAAKLLVAAVRIVARISPSLTFPEGGGTIRRARLLSRIQSLRGPDRHAPSEAEALLERQLHPFTTFGQWSRYS